MLAISFSREIISSQLYNMFSSFSFSGQSWDMKPWEETLMKVKSVTTLLRAWGNSPDGTDWVLVFAYLSHCQPCRCHNWILGTFATEMHAVEFLLKGREHSSSLLGRHIHNRGSAILVDDSRLHSYTHSLKGQLHSQAKRKRGKSI